MEGLDDSVTGGGANAPRQAAYEPLCGLVVDTLRSDPGDALMVVQLVKSPISKPPFLTSGVDRAIPGSIINTSDIKISSIFGIESTPWSVVCTYLTLFDVKHSNTKNSPFKNNIRNC